MVQGIRQAFDSGTRVERPRTGVRIVLIAVLFAMVWFSASGASAHTYLVSTDPNDGTTISTVPEQVRLKFTEEIQLDFVDVTVSVADGPAYGALTEVEDGWLVVTVPPGAAAEQPESQAAEWKIEYRVTASDGHPINEVYSFMVSPSSRASEVETPTQSTAESGWNSARDPLQIPGWMLAGLGVMTAVIVSVADFALHRQHKTRR